mmetsp:Transcript_10256/g.12444  ORF Transcript_10256/g.12444 Transcript_10256/m.12444 type:complete len:226 (-) Transcript_10256:134-811(-)|eukprot:CAMPEP_0114351010 /NCGR_PEP_ID=MMETSP0101-20121206/16837_1 /TAXON_ID=38822 ORGANISM="Pteridomonas danica, Strain PT" /NCGR_SAMPLE_ID=MMETSP0101 /ASSEMBLY_ACC=CAM_ASM_000211 /LENGTH=225 /DNA_ID=CAMNT_0001490621 /DNA_START=19 /DNA_END=696 /DNA_ORIENTATION=-
MAVPGSRSALAGKRSIETHSIHPNSRPRFKPPLPAGPPPLSKTDIEPEVGESKNLFVGNLDLTVTESDILKIFSRMGEIKSCSFRLHFTGPNKGRPRGFCFVEMLTHSQAQKCIDTLHGRRLRGRELRVNYAREVDDTPIVEQTSQEKSHIQPPQENQWTLDKRAKMVKQTLKNMGADIDVNTKPKYDISETQDNLQETNTEIEAEAEADDDDAENVVTDILNSA